MEPGNLQGLSQNTHAEITDLVQQQPIPEPELDNGTMADRIRDRRRNAAQVAERALEEIRLDGAFDYDSNFEYIIEDDTNGFHENDNPVYEQQQWRPRRPHNLGLNPGCVEKCCDYCHALLIDTELPSFCCDRGKFLLGEIFKEPSQYTLDVLLDPITSKYSRTINTILGLQKYW